MNNETQHLQNAPRGPGKKMTDFFTATLCSLQQVQANTLQPQQVYTSRLALKMEAAAWLPLCTANGAGIIWDGNCQRQK